MNLASILEYLAQRAGNRPPAANFAEDSFFEFYRELFGQLYRVNGVNGATLAKRCERFFIDACIKIEPVLCLEIGAYEASFSREIKARLPDAKVVALEANPFVFEKHKDAVATASVDYRHL